MGKIGTMHVGSQSVIDLTPATQTTDGLMSAVDKKKLDGIAENANNFTYTLPLASATVRGGVKVGYTANGKNYPVQIANEQLFVNVPWTDTNTTYSAATQSANGLMSAADKTKLDGIAASANAYTLPLATASVRGGAKIGYTANGKNYPVQLSNEQMFVNVPWTDTNTTYANMKGATASAAGTAGLAPAPAAGAQTKYLRGDGTWQTPPDTTYTAATVAPKAAGTAAVGTSAKYAREDHVHPAQTTITGNAGTATKLGTARTINGTSFDGSANITTANWGTARNLTIGNTAKSVNGSANVAWTLDEIGVNSYGENPTRKGENVHTEGLEVSATGVCAHAEGYRCIASGNFSHAEGSNTLASGHYSCARGSSTQALGMHSSACGYYTVASKDEQCAIGTYNVKDSEGFFVIGNGYVLLQGGVAYSNCFRVERNGVFAAGEYASSGADYAEMFEWEDGNPNHEDRAGLFVTLDGENIKPISSEDDFILGIVSGNPSVLGDVYDDQWNQMYLTDIFGRPIWEDIEITDEDGNKHIQTQQKVNPEYNSEEQYTGRTKRPEWDAVGMLGKLVAVDDGTCKVNGWCKPSVGGKATHSEAKTNYRVMKRLDDNHIKILIV